MSDVQTLSVLKINLTCHPPHYVLVHVQVLYASIQREVI